MKNFYSKIFLFITIFLIGLLVNTKTTLAATSLSVNTGGGQQANAYLYLPSDYNSTSTRYPLLVFMHGAGEGDCAGGLPAIYNSSGAGGPPYLIEHGQWPESFKNPSDGKSYKFIVLAPQHPCGWSLSAAQLNSILTNFVPNYRVDTSRIYITGLSAGGDSTIRYAVHDEGFTPTYLPAAIAPMSPAIPVPPAAWGTRIVSENIGTWSFGQEPEDSLGTRAHQFVDVINAASPGFARFTDYGGYGAHCCWNLMYNPAYKENFGGNMVNMYEWMLQYKRDGNLVPVDPTTPLPYGGSPHAIPGTVEAENFDTGGEGIAYHDNTSNNVAGKYRPAEGVDIENTLDSSGNYNVGWTENGEWMKYTVVVNTSGTYTIGARIASSGTSSIRFEIDDQTVATADLPATGGYQNWQTVNLPNVTLSAGKHVMRLYQIKGGANLNYFTFTKNGSAPNPNPTGDFNSSRIAIDAEKMVINDNVVGDERKLFDEQNTLVVDSNGDPVQSNPAPRDCGDFWNERPREHKCFNFFDTPGVREVSYPPTLSIDLKANYKVTDVYVYRQTGKQDSTTDLIEVRSGTPFHFDNKIGGHKFNNTIEKWVRIPMAENNTRFLQLLLVPDAGTIKEVVIYGQKTGQSVNDSISPVKQQQHYTMDRFIGTNVSYGMGDGYDKDYDSQWGTIRAYSGLQYHFDKNDNLVKQQNGSYAANLMAQQMSEGADLYNVLQGIPLSMANPNNPGTGNDHKPIDYTLCDGTIAIKGVPTCHGVADEPQSYAHKAYLARLYAAEYGPSKNSAYKQKFIELGNEPDGSWNEAGYFTPFELAAMLSADYDGHCDAIRYKGQKVGVKNGDPNMKVVMPGLASIGSGDLRYLESMNFWWQYNRPCSPTIPVDVINVHFYSTSQGMQRAGDSGRGLSPEEYGMREVMKRFVDFRDQYSPAVDVAVTEFGFDSYPETMPPVAPGWCKDAYYGNSIIAAHPIGSYDSDEVQGQWIARSYLEMAAAGIDFTNQFWLGDEYMINTVCGTFAASGLLKQLNEAINYRPQYTPRPSWYYTQTLRSRLMGMKYESDKKVNGITVMKFRDTSNRNHVAYVVWSPTSNGYTKSNFNLPLDKSASAEVINLTSGSENGQVIQSIKSAVSNIVIPVSERPTIIVVNESAVSGGSEVTKIISNAGTDQTIKLPVNSVTLVGLGSGNTIVSYAWTKISGGNATIVSPSSATTAITNLSQGSYTFRLTVTDSTGTKATDDVKVTVNAATQSSGSNSSTSSGGNSESAGGSNQGSAGGGGSSSGSSGGGGSTNSNSNSSESAQSNNNVPSNYPVGCTATTKYSAVTGKLCFGNDSSQANNPVTNYPVGCTETTKYSAVTGKLCSDASSVSNTPSNSGESSVSVTANVLNVRSAPVNGSVITQLKKGALVTVISGLNGWSNVLLPDGTKGWVSSRYTTSVTETTVTSEVPVVSSGHKVTVTAELLNVRTQPKGAVITVVPFGTSGVVLIESTTWPKVLFENHVAGYVSSTYLR